MPIQCRLLTKKASATGQWWYEDDTGQIVPNKRPGDMWYVSTGEGQRHILVMLPDKEIWDIDGRSTGGGPGWTRTGEAPNVTASPSINSGTYHGFLQNGQLTPDLEGRTYGN